MYSPGDVIDDKYEVIGPCSDAGGMGTLLFVTLKGVTMNPPLVLKYCKQTEKEVVDRFAREVRLMSQFKGNERVIQVLASNLRIDPPYFVMRFYEDGDLTTLGAALRADLGLQESVFNKMIDCLSELHALDLYHRDVKPQNFLRRGGELVVCDLGLCTEIEAGAGITRSSKYWGTPGYIPPEFLARGGFKDADATADVFMLGKTFYSLLSDRDPMYMTPDGIPPQLYVIIERCCSTQRSARYQSLASLRQSLASAYDVLLGRVVGSHLAARTLRAISDRLRGQNQYQAAEVVQLVEQLELLEVQDKIQICMELPEALFTILGQAPVQSHLNRFLSAYEVMVTQANYAWSFAETIAKSMQAIFDSPDVAPVEKMLALRIAATAAYRQNRFAAMDTCRAMIMRVEDDELAQRVHDFILETEYSFITRIQETAVNHPAIRAGLANRALKDEQM